jgi:uncharacterized protein
VELARVAEGTDLLLDLRMESVVEGVLVSGTVTGTVSGECGRCLEPFSREISVDLQELYAYPDSATDVSADEDEVGRLSGERLDLQPAVRDAIVLALPLAPLCRDDCRGLCPGCGTRWDELPTDHTHETTDPRWAALAERFGAGTDDRPSDSQET